VSLVQAVPAMRRSQEAAMSMPPDVPETIQSAALLILHLCTKPVLTQQDREAIRKARLKVAFWACVAEKIIPTHDNLVYILGSTAHEVIDVLRPEGEKSEAAGPEGQIRFRNRGLVTEG